MNGEKDNFHLEENTKLSRLSAASGIRPLTAAYQASASTNQVCMNTLQPPSGDKRLGARGCLNWNQMSIFHDLRTLHTGNKLLEISSTL